MESSPALAFPARHPAITNRMKHHLILRFHPRNRQRERQIYVPEKVELKAQPQFVLSLDSLHGHLGCSFADGNAAHDHARLSNFDRVPVARSERLSIDDCEPSRLRSADA